MTAEKQETGLAPHSLEAEEALLGAVLINPDAYHECDGVKPDDFFILRNGIVWQAIATLNARGEVVEYTTLIDHLKTVGKLDEIGGPARITYLVSGTASSTNAPIYAELVRRAAVRRRLLTAADEISKLARAADKDLPTVINAAEDAFFSVTGDEREKDWTPAMQAVGDFYSRLEAVYTDRLEPFKVKTFIPELDRVLGGFKPRMHIIAARPGEGKTNLVVDLSCRMAANGLSVGIMSLEMDSEEIMGRIFANQTGIDSQKYDDPRKMTEKEWERFVAYTDRVGRWELYIDDSAGQTPANIRSKAMRLIKKHRLDVLFVDYLQLVDVDNPKGKSEVQQMSEISKAIRKTAKRLGVPIIATAQLSRAVEARPGKKPQLSDLRESGQIEQDAYSVMFLHHAMQADADAHEDTYNVVMAKNRGGAKGVLQFRQRKEIAKFFPIKDNKQDSSEAI